MASPHVAILAFPFSSHATKLLLVAHALATSVPSATFSFLSTHDSLARLHRAVPENLRLVEVSWGGGDEEMPELRRIEMFVEAAEAGGLKQALEVASAAAGGARVSCVVGDAFMSMAAETGLPWVAVWTGSPSALLAHVHGDAIRGDIGDHAASRAEELLISHKGLEIYRIRDLPFGGIAPSGDMYRVMSLLLRRVAQRVPRFATAVALNAFPGLFPPSVSAALEAALPNCLPIGPYHLLPSADAPVDDPHGCLTWLARHPAGTVAYVSFGTVAALAPDELRELAFGLEASGAPFLWSLREDTWPLLPPGFMDGAVAKGSGMLVAWAPQAAVLRHAAVGAFVTHSGWGAVVEAISCGVPMACRPVFGDQQMNARTVEHLWGFGITINDDIPMTRGRVVEALAMLVTGEEGARMRARVRDIRSIMVRAFQPHGGSMNNLSKFVEVVCAHV